MFVVRHLISHTLILSYSLYSVSISCSKLLFFFFAFNICVFFCLTFGWLFFFCFNFLACFAAVFTLSHIFNTNISLTNNRHRFSFYLYVRCARKVIFCIYFGPMHIHLMLTPLPVVCIVNKSPSCFSLHFKRHPNYVSHLFVHIIAFFSLSLFLCRSVDYGYNIFGF